MKRELNVLIGLVALWCGMIIGAPLLSGRGGSFAEVSSFLYSFFGTICHQFASRSFFIDGHPFGVCIRCTAIYGGFLFGCVGMRLFPLLRLHQFNTIFFLAVSSLPMAADVALSLFPGYDSTTISRLITGSWFGIGIALFLRDSLIDIIAVILPQHSSAYSYEFKAR